MRVGACVAVSVAALSIASVSRAAPAPPCFPAAVTPESKTFPANLPGFQYAAANATAADIHLYTLPSRAEVPLTVTKDGASGLANVAVSSPFVAGTSYELTYASFCDFSTPTVTRSFTATEAAPFPTRIAGDGSGDPVLQWSPDFDAYTIAIVYPVADEMKPWEAAYSVVSDVIDLGSNAEKDKAPGASAELFNDRVGIRNLILCERAKLGTKKHFKVTLRGTLPLAAPIADPPRDLEVDCPATPASPGSTPAATPATQRTASSSSCAARPRGGAGFSGALAVVGAALALRMRARRRSTR